MKKILLITLTLLFSFGAYSQKKRKRVSDRKQNIIETIVCSQINSNELFLEITFH